MELKGVGVLSRKIIFVDLDGTLLRDDKTISDVNRQALQEALEVGHYIVFATGRAVSSGRNIAKKLELEKPGCYLIAYNGAVIYDCAAERTLNRKSMPIEYAEYLTREAEKAGLYIQAYSESQILTRKHTKELDLYLKRTGMQYRIEKDIWSLLNQEPPKMLLISLDHPDKLHQFQEEHRAWEEGKCTSFFSCAEYLEYCPYAVTKGIGVEYLQKFLNIQPENTIAIGDHENDISMIQNAYLGVAMQNAQPVVKECADYITENDNEHDGVAEVIHKFVL